MRVSGLRGAHRPSNEHEDGRPVALTTDLAYTEMDQPPRQTNGRRTSKVVFVNQVLPSKTHQVDSKQDYGPQGRTNLTLRRNHHRVVKLILQEKATIRQSLNRMYIRWDKNTTTTTTTTTSSSSDDSLSDSDPSSSMCLSTSCSV